MKKVTHSISIDDVRNIVQSELKSIKETVDHNAVKDIVTAASKLLSAVEGFSASATPAAVNAVTPHLSSLQQILEDMVNSPSSYVQKQKKEPKVVSLKPIKS
jgi:hypothetical protein